MAILRGGGGGGPHDGWVLMAIGWQGCDLNQKPPGKNGESGEMISGRPLNTMVEGATEIEICNIYAPLEKENWQFVW